MDCQVCPERVQKLRRCREDRWDFTEKDGSAWPMYVEPGGEMYGFCPAKAGWDPNLIRLFQLLLIATETGVMIERGGLRDQPSWWIEQLAWFATKYDSIKFASRMKSVLGDGTVRKAVGTALAGRGSKNGGNKRVTPR